MEREKNSDEFSDSQGHCRFEVFFLDPIAPIPQYLLYQIFDELSAGPNNYV
jgi:hypothetical protein